MLNEMTPSVFLRKNRTRKKSENPIVSRSVTYRLENDDDHSSCKRYEPFTSLGMRGGQPTDDEVITKVTQALASCDPPIEFGSIEAGDFEDGRRILALINFVKQGNGVLGEPTRRSPFQVVNTLNTALKAIQGASSAYLLSP
jgi:hypothetical protein